MGAGSTIGRLPHFTNTQYWGRHIMRWKASGADPTRRRGGAGARVPASEPHTIAQAEQRNAKSVFSPTPDVPL